MAYSYELIEHANFLVDLNVPNDPKQVDLRRAVSAAYYALFHLLTSEAARNWKHDRHQARFARIFDHRPMKTCSSTIASKQPPSDPPKLAVFAKLKVVAETSSVPSRLVMMPTTTIRGSGRELRPTKR